MSLAEQTLISHVIKAYKPDGRWQLAERQPGTPYEARSLSDAIDKVKELSKWVKAEYVICTVCENRSLNLNED